MLVFGLSLWSDAADVTSCKPALSFARLSSLQSLKKPKACAATVLRPPVPGITRREAAVLRPAFLPQPPSCPLTPEGGGWPFPGAQEIQICLLGKSGVGWQARAGGGRWVAQRGVGWELRLPTFCISSSQALHFLPFPLRPFPYGLPH